MGKPVILGVDGESRQILEAANGGIYIEPENCDAFIAAIDQVENNMEAYQKNAIKVKQYVKQHFNRDTLAKAYLELLAGEIA